MKKILFILLLIPIILQGQDTLSVFFIGNSYTNYNNLPSMVANMANANGKVLNTVSHTPGGSTLEQHASNSNVNNILSNQQFDFVVLQEQSQKPSFPPTQVASEVYPYAQDLVNQINNSQNCAQSVFYMTWGRENGDQANCQFYPPLCTYAGMQQRLRESYTEMADDNNAIVSPVGAIWQQVRISDPNISLYTGDGSHPNIVGSFLAAHAFYGTFYHELPPISFLPNGVTPAQQNLIRTATELVLFDSIANWNIDTTSLMVNHIDLSDSTSIILVNNTADSCTWTINGTVYVGDTLNYQANWGDIISITQTVHRNCITKSSFIELTIEENPSGIESLQRHEIRVYPNPSQNEIFVEANLGLTQYEIYNVNGQLIQFETLENNRIDISNLKSGLYFIRFSNINNIVYFSDFLKK